MSREYRVDQVGSLLRPPELIQARAAFGTKQMPLEQLRKLEDQAIGDILEMQRQVGVPSSLVAVIEGLTMLFILAAMASAERKER